MLGTIRTIQRQAGQALPTCAQPNHNLMNTLGTVCSKLLPVGARATGNPPCHHTLPLPLHLTSFATVSFPTRLNRLAPVLRPSTLTPNQIKILISVLSAFHHSSERQRVQRQAYMLHVWWYGLTANVFMCRSWIGYIWCVSDNCFSICLWKCMLLLLIIPHTCAHTPHTHTYIYEGSMPLWMLWC